MTIQTTSTSASAVSDAKPEVKAYQFPSAPTSFEFCTGKKQRVVIPDGVYRTADTAEIAELEAAVTANIIYPYTGDIISPTQVPPAPIDPTKTN